MIIVCGDCGARFQMDPALFGGARGGRVRCRKCGGRIDVLNPEAPAAPPESAPAAAPAPEVEATPSIGAETAAAAEPDTRRIEPFSRPADPNLPTWLETGPSTGAQPELPPAKEPQKAAILTGTERRPEKSEARVPLFVPTYRRGPRRYILPLTVAGILLLAGGAFLFRDTKPVQKLLRNVFPPAVTQEAERAVSPVIAEVKPAYEIRDLNSFRQKAFKGGNMFVIQGTVVNVGNGPSRGILVRATLLSKDRKALVDYPVYAGNLLDNTTLRHADREVIAQILALRNGEKNVNRDIPAGGSVPFMAVFFDPPAQLESYTVNAADAE
jgi:predicted Zn finger-like uncharacterized protein